MTMKTKLSERVRPAFDAKEWVCTEITILDAKLDAAIEQLLECENVFRMYSESHSKKNTIDGDNKATINKNIAEKIHDLCNSIRGH